MDPTYYKIFITIILAVLGWLVGHYFTSKRDISNKRRELVTGYLIEAYRLLTNDVSHRGLSDQVKRNLEVLISDIQLFGNSQQIEFAKKLADEVAQGGEFELDYLINSLRDSLRDELQLSKVSGNIRWLRLDAD